MQEAPVHSGIFSSDPLPPDQVEFCVVSDIHIACGDRNDYVFDENNKPVSGEAYTLARFCHKIKISGEAGHFRDNSHILILLGDIVNGGECGYFDCYNSQAFKNLYSAVEPWLYTGNILYFAGNHDKNAKFYNTVAKFPRKSVVETIDCETRKEAVFSKHGVLFEHGHKFDCLCSGKTFLGLMGDFASDIVANLCTPDLEDLLRGRDFYYDHSKENGIKEVPKETTIKSLSYEDRKVANGALNLLSKHPDCHTIICGHTHQSPVRITVQNNGQTITYYNTGKFARDGYLNIRVKKTI